MNSQRFQLLKEAIEASTHSPIVEDMRDLAMAYENTMAQLATVTKERDEAREANARIVRGEFAQICGYCGWEAPAKGATWEELQEHIKTCPKHPLTTAREENERLKRELALAKEGYVALDPSLMALIGELVEGVEPLEEYEQPCALCGTPMFSDEPMEPGEVHGTCKAAVEKLTAENATLRSKVEELTQHPVEKVIRALIAQGYSCEESADILADYLHRRENRKQAQALQEEK